MVLDPKELPDAVGSMLSIAEGWKHFGGDVDANRILDWARDKIIANQRGGKGGGNWMAAQLADTVSKYLLAAGRGSPAETSGRTSELLRQLGPFENNMTSASHFAVHHNQIAEALMRAMAGDGHSLSDQARKWRDENEYLTRRRIHSDMRSTLAKEGL
jgi:hypothetical protein